MPCSLARLVVLVLALVSFTAYAAEPMSKAARPYFLRGRRHFEARRYADAIAEFAAGYAIDANPDFLYARGQAERLSGDCEGATRSYRAFLATSPPASEAALAEKNITRCAPAVVAEPPVEPAPATPSPAVGPSAEEPGASPPVVPPPAASPPAASVEAPKPAPVFSPRGTAPPAEKLWYRDAWAGALVGSGVAALTVGVIYLVSADGHVDVATYAESLEDYDHESALADEQRTVGTWAMAAGGLLLGAGIVRWYLLPAPRTGSPVAVDVTARAGGGFLLVRGSF